MDASVFVTGLAMGLSLIVAIGAQNAFVLRQGLRDEYVFAVALTCSLSDAILIAVGVTGFGKITGWLPWIDPAMRWGGAIFLAWYGAKILRSALRSTEALTSETSARKADFGKVMLTCLAFTWLNPHVYLDTVALLGTISTQFPGREASFAAGAMSGSVLFFFSLAYGATRLGPIFARPISWRMLEAIIAVVMWTIALRLVTGH
jgi:L-lysine exporter family protein LysE/ArgO